MEYLHGNHFVIGVSERRGGRSIKAVLERKSFAKRPFCSQFLERKGNGRLYGGTEWNRSNQAGSKFCLFHRGKGGQPRLWHTKLRRCSSRRYMYLTNKSQGLTRKKKKIIDLLSLGRCETGKFGSSTLRPDSEAACRL